MQFEMPKFEMPKFEMPNFPQPGATVSATKGLSKVAVTGSTGLLGTALAKAFSASDIEVVPITRGADGALSISPDLLEGVDAVVHLAGENVATGTGPLAFLGIQAWSDAKKAEIIKSRVEGTQAVVAAINACSNPPRTLVCASGVGYYGFQTGDATVTESSPIGGGFLAEEVCAAWEGATAGAKCRVVRARFGVVLAAGGGALAKLLPIFQLGGGGIIGSGSQYFSWISARDAVSAIRKILETPSISGPVNVCAPQPVTNAEFTSAMGSVLGRPTLLPFPAFAVSLLFGQMGEEMLLGGQRAVPQKLTAAGFQFQDPTIEQGVATAIEAP